MVIKRALIDELLKDYKTPDDKILSLYARGMTVREIRSHLEEMYGVEVSPDLISGVTDEVMEKVRDWQVRPLFFPRPAYKPASFI